MRYDSTTEPVGALEKPFEDDPVHDDPTGQLAESAISVGSPDSGSALHTKVMIVGRAPASAPRPSYMRLLRPTFRPDEIGVLGNYRVLRPLGEGGMAHVFLAEDRDLHRPVALKVMKPALESDPTASQRFLREARSLAAINSDHVVKVFQVGQEGPAVFMAMERLNGLTLDDWIVRDGPPRAAELVRLTREIATGLDAIHASGLIHRDLKPNNIWIEEPGNRVKLLDFGLARPISDNLKFTDTGFIVGTPAFMSPEQARGKQIDTRSDLFSLGAVLYFLCSGKLPFDADTAVGILTAVSVDQPEPIEKLNAALPSCLTSLIGRLLQKNADQRPSSAREVIECLQATQVRVVRSDRTPREPVERVVEIPEAAAAADPLERRRRIGLRIGLALTLGILVFGVVQRNLKSGLPERSADAAERKTSTPEAADQPIAPVAPGAILVADNCNDKYARLLAPEDHLTLYDANGVKVFQIGGLDMSMFAGSNRTIATDLKRGRVWLAENCKLGTIRRFDLAGNETLKIELDKAQTPLALDVDPETGDLWAIVNYGSITSARTHVYDQGGHLIDVRSVAGCDLVYDRCAKSFWVAGSSLFKIPTSTRREERVANLTIWTSVSIDVDPNSGIVWVAAPDHPDVKNRNRLLRFDPSRMALSEFELKDRFPRRVSVDPVNGGVWVCNSGKSLTHYATNGLVLGEFPIMATSLQVDAAGGDVWVATAEELLRINAQGLILRRTPHPSKTAGAFLGVFR